MSPGTLKPQDRALSNAAICESTAKSSPANAYKNTLKVVLQPICCPEA